MDGDIDGFINAYLKQKALRMLKKLKNQKLYHLYYYYSFCKKILLWEEIFYEKNILQQILSVALLFCGCSISKGNNDTENNAESTTNETTNTAETTLEATGLGVILSDYDTNAIVAWGPGNIQNHERPVDPEKLQSQYSDLNGKWLLADDKNICLTQLMKVMKTAIQLRF